MKKAESSVVFGSSVDKVWGKVTDHQEISWRSDLSDCKVDKGGFTEYSLNGIATRFTVTMCIPHQRYEMDLENKNLSGHWIGVFQMENGRVRVTFTEEITLKTKNPFSRLFAGSYLKKQQKRYFRDLKKALGEE